MQFLVKFKGCHSQRSLAKVCFVGPGTFSSIKPKTNHSYQPVNTATKTILLAFMQIVKVTKRVLIQ